MNLINGQSIADAIRKKTSERVLALKKLGIKTKLAVIIVGNDMPSQTYVRKKGESANAVGIDFALHKIPETITTEDLVKKINEMQNDPELSGLIVQLPLPASISTDVILNAIRPDIDVDCLTNYNLGKLIMNTQTITPPTPGAVMEIIQHIGADLIGKNVTIIGTGQLVGRPLAVMMINARASVTTCNSKTKNIKEKCLSADIIVTGVGKKNILRGDMVPEGAIVIDTGVSFENGKMSGDVNIEEVGKKAAYVTPTPGGIGPITVARLLLNTVICAEQRYACIK